MTLSREIWGETPRTTPRLTEDALPRDTAPLHRTPRDTAPLHRTPHDAAPPRDTAPSHDQALALLASRAPTALAPDVESAVRAVVERVQAAAGL